MQASLLAQQGRYPEAYEALSAYMNDYKQHFNQALSQHAATFQAEMDLARSEPTTGCCKRRTSASASSCCINRAPATTS
nr:hypothetical protein [Aeromonas salmonicida]